MFSLSRLFQAEPYAFLCPAGTFGLSEPDRAGACTPEGRTALPAAARGCPWTAVPASAATGPSSSLAKAEETRLERGLAWPTSISSSSVARRGGGLGHRLRPGGAATMASMAAPSPDAERCNELVAIVAQQFLHALDRVALVIEQMPDALDADRHRAGGNSGGRRRASSA